MRINRLNANQREFQIQGKIIHQALTLKSINFSSPAAIIAFQPDFVEPVVNISVVSGRDATFTCHVRHLGGYRVSLPLLSPPVSPQPQMALPRRSAG